MMHHLMKHRVTPQTKHTVNIYLYVNVDALLFVANIYFCLALTLSYPIRSDVFTLLCGVEL
jgi:hypothetical protein